ncbi:MAG: response regulator [Cyclobacteriaceae bacterium]|nr:response regulator [Cyclobacteriaceae bacterium]
MAKTVLVVDDSLFMRELIRETLEDAGYVVVGEAENGEDAIEMTLELNPDIVTLDNVLPDINGTEVLKVYKEEGINPDVIMISGVGQDAVINEGLSLGAKDYLVKPFTPDQLLDALDAL